MRPCSSWDFCAKSLSAAWIKSAYFIFDSSHRIRRSRTLRNDTSTRKELRQLCRTQNADSRWHLNLDESHQDRRNDQAHDVQADEHERDQGMRETRESRSRRVLRTTDFSPRV